MYEISILSEIISKQNVKNIEIISQNKKDSSLTNKLYQELINGRIQNDDDGCMFLYNDLTKKNQYLNVKFRLKKKLLNTLFFINLKDSKNSEYNIAYNKLCKEWIQTRLLLNRNARPLAIKQCEKILKLTQKFEFTDLSLLISRDLRKHFGYLNPNREKFLYYINIVKQSTRDLNAELKAEEYYSSISNHYAFSKSSKRTVISKLLNDYCEELLILKETINTYKFNYLTYSLIIFKHIIDKEYEVAINIGLEAMRFFDNKPFKSNLAYSLIYDDLINCNIKLKKFDSAQFYIDENLIRLENSSINWFKSQNYNFTLLSMMNEYQKQYHVTLLVLNSKYLKHYKIHYESWLVKEAYVHFLIRIGKIIPDESEGKKLKPFRLGRFLNEVPLFSKDKRGLNIAILIIQMLFLISDQKYGKVIDRIDALKQYSYRYLRKNETFRSNCFIKMLIKIPETSFHPVRLKAHTQALYKRLSSTSMEISEQSTEIEIIPYENLWELVLGLLEKRKGK